MNLPTLITLLTTLTLHLTTITTATPLETRNVPGILKEFALTGEKPHPPRQSRQTLRTQKRRPRPRTQTKQRRSILDQIYECRSCLPTV
ncbi:hypothetical protein BDV41DRAFT_520116 [Aspergillus transmontanensis]|uniref:Uncharacterized protein n=1 Tax=Aspergillus transmontanensis TaxID=1034304 RepID=A0A5N6WF52_9EURO|nr:hypothetical protein BDV41DRAFT_520116 [Aspergillus transmontanensis]